MMATKSKVVAAIKAETLRKRAEPIAKQIVMHFGVQLVTGVGAPDPFNIASPAVKRFLKHFGGVKIVGINRSTQARVSKVLARMTDEGASVAKIKETIAAKFTQWSEGRAYVIAKTEVAGASNFGAFEGMHQAGVEDKEWFATVDSHVRDTHAELDGTVVAVDEPFEIDGLEAMYPGDFGDPAEDVNCRCGVLPVVQDKALRNRFTVRNLERQRAPFDRRMLSAFKRGFLEQRAVVLAALGE